MILAQASHEDVISEHVFYLKRIARFITVVAAIHACILYYLGEAGILFYNSIATAGIMTATWLLFHKRRIQTAEILMAFGSIAVAAVSSYMSPYFANSSPMLLIIALQVPLMLSTAKPRWSFLSIITACILFILLNTPEFHAPVELPITSLTATLMNSAIASSLVMFIALSGVYGVRRYSKLRRKHQEQEAQLIHSAKLASLGEMAAGIAHEINNPLAIIDASAWKLRLSLSKKKNLDPDDVLKTAILINESAQRMTEIIKGMRYFSRDGALDPFEFVTARKVIDDSVIMCKSRLSLNDTTLKISDTNLFDVTIETIPVHLSQVIVNIIQNGADAAALNPAPADRWILISCRQPDSDFIDITITDSGPGISDQVAKKIFEPFFTTKEAGKGTGLGLSVSKSIMEKIGGKMLLTAEGHHTCFVIRVPIRRHEREVGG